MGGSVTINGVVVAVPEGAVAYKYADPLEDAYWLFDEGEARRVSSDDPALVVWVGGGDEG